MPRSGRAALRRTTKRRPCPSRGYRAPSQIAGVTVYSPAPQISTPGSNKVALPTAPHLRSLGGSSSGLGVFMAPFGLHNPWVSSRPAVCMAPLPFSMPSNDSGSWKKKNRSRIPQKRSPEMGFAWSSWWDLNPRPAVYEVGFVTKTRRSGIGLPYFESSCDAIVSRQSAEELC